VLRDLPTPDAAFIGGGGTAVVEAVVARQPARIVVALAAVDRVAPACDVLGTAGYTVDGTLLQAARLSPLPGGVHRFDAINPVFLLWATRPSGGGKPARVESADAVGWITDAEAVPTAAGGVR
jgi:precorrin-6Y C5,15-methyltransferase (decarboxylating)